MVKIYRLEVLCFSKTVRHQLSFHFLGNTLQPHTVQFRVCSKLTVLHQQKGKMLTVLLDTPLVETKNEV